MIILCLLAMQVPAQIGSIRVHLVDEMGAVINTARIRLTEPGGRQLDEVMAKDGEAIIDNIPAGASLVLSVESPGFVVGRVDLKLHADQHRDLTVALAVRMDMGGLQVWRVPPPEEVKPGAVTPSAQRRWWRRLFRK